jgi:hypothetical protein
MQNFLVARQGVNELRIMRVVLPALELVQNGEQLAGCWNW